MTYKTNKGNRRVLVTKKLISEALLKLLETRSIEKITITELCETAHVNRSTFYHHYTSQYDVLTEIEDEKVEDIKAMLDKIDPKRSFTIREQVEAICVYLKENKSAFLLFMNSKYILKDFSEKMFDITMKKGFSEDRAPKELSDEQKKLWESFYQGGLYYLIYSWLSGSSQASPAEAADLICAFIPAINK
ncbi:MAG: TetR/AcrR family transcriptional regulator [Oscillospiraceae bacterium]|nr:TetR/AcrR family transcriptional regulator [Oscillospiraceae bacterium]